MKEINQLRANPASYIEKVESQKQFIVANTEEGSKTSAFYVKDNTPKISLTRGVVVFDEIINILKNTKPMDKLEFREDLQIPIPEDSAKWTAKDNISEIVKNKKDSLKGNSSYNNFNFHFDVGSPYSEISFILQLIDDTPFKGARSKNILNPTFKYIGISSLKVKNKHCGYYLFAN